MTASRICDVLVVGGGIGGLAIGCALARNKRSVVVLEARSSLRPSKRGLTLQPNGLETLQRMGLLDNVSKIGVAVSHVVWYDSKGDQLADLDYSVLDHPYNYLLTVIPSELEQILREEFLRRGGELEESTVFMGLTWQQDRVTVTAKREDSLLEYSAKILVGADGEQSPVRQTLQLPFKIKECLDHFLFMLVGPVEPIRQAARQYLGRGKMIGLYPVPRGTYVFYYIPKGTIESLRARGFDSFKTEISHSVPEVRTALSDLQSWDDIVYAQPKRVHVQNWVEDRVALLGDAAHATDPSWAQGANMTLQDADVLADTIEKCFQSHDFSASRLMEYQTMRRKQTLFIQRQSDRTARMTATESRLNHWLGKRIIRKIGRDQDLMRTALKASAGLTDHLGLWEQFRFIL